MPEVKVPGKSSLLFFPHGINSLFLDSIFIFKYFEEMRFERPPTLSLFLKHLPTYSSIIAARCLMVNKDFLIIISQKELTLICRETEGDNSLQLCLWHDCMWLYMSFSLFRFHDSITLLKISDIRRIGKMNNVRHL